MAIRLANANVLGNSAVKNIRVQYSIYLLIKRSDSQPSVFMKVANYVVIHQRNLSLQMFGMSWVKENQQKCNCVLLWFLPRHRQIFSWKKEFCKFNIVTKSLPVGDTGVSALGKMWSNEAVRVTVFITLLVPPPYRLRTKTSMYLLWCFSLSHIGDSC